MRSFYHLLVGGLTLLLVLQYGAHVFGFDDTLFLEVSFFISALLALSIVLSTPVLLLKKNLRNIRSLVTTLIALAALIVFLYLDIKFYEYWKLEVRNNSPSEFSFNVAHLSSPYSFDFAVPAHGNRHIFIPVWKLKNSEDGRSALGILLEQPTLAPQSFLEHSQGRLGCD